MPTRIRSAKKAEAEVGAPPAPEKQKEAPVPVLMVRITGISDKAQRQITGMLSGFGVDNVRALGSGWEITGLASEAEQMRVEAVRILHEQYGFINAEQYVTKLV